MIFLSSKGETLSKPRVDEGFTEELGESDAQALLEMAEDARSKRARAGWLIAYRKHRFLGISEELRNNLKTCAELFGKLNREPK